jgi:hypothetical protein
MKMKTAIAVVALAAFGFAHDEDKGKPVTITGTVIDTGCYMSHDAIGEKHTDCATVREKRRAPCDRRCRW